MSGVNLTCTRLPVAYATGFIIMKIGGVDTLSTAFFHVVLSIFAAKSYNELSLQDTKRKENLLWLSLEKI